MKTNSRFASAKAFLPLAVLLLCLWAFAAYADDSVNTSVGIDEVRTIWITSDSAGNDDLENIDIPYTPPGSEAQWGDTGYVNISSNTDWHVKVKRTASDFDDFDPDLDLWIHCDAWSGDDYWKEVGTSYPGWVVFADGPDAHDTVTFTFKVSGLGWHIPADPDPSVTVTFDIFEG